ncbi:endocuticle structural glycoprotein ABD-4-like [Rhynchophorus ferrugineus]|uniref:endocuticle structural glycoprotein ABD-4-like n=1 Tax=Rhynchophorus ferrugineus TaxID=354439 RepID=UPI003FCC6984
MLTKVIVFILACIITASVGLPVQSEPVPIISQDSHLSPDGSYQWNYESGDGTSQHQSGSIVQVDKDHAVENVEGSVSYVDPDGKKHDTTYIAGPDGYVAQSADIPVAPPIPEAIQKSLAWQEAHPEPESKKQ